MHQAGLTSLGIAGRYLAIDVDADGMRHQAGRVRCGALSGANITMPHKRLAAQLADVLTPQAARAGSVNTWSWDGDDLIGESTDIGGLNIAIERRQLDADRILILGSGGAAAAAIVASAGRDLHVSGRSPESVQRLIAGIDVSARVVPWGDAVRGATVINATPIGMQDEIIPEAILESAGGLFDLVYRLSETPSVRFARQAGLPTADGIDLLVAQAELSFEIWTGFIPEAGLFEQVARKLSRD